MSRARYARTPGATAEPDLPVMRTARQATGTVAGTTGADVTVAWAVPFADASYTVTASVVQDAGGDALIVRRIRSVTASQVVVNVVNNGLMSGSGIVHVVGVHD